MRRIPKYLALTASLLSIVVLALSLISGTHPARAAASDANGQTPGLVPARFITFGSVGNFSADADTVPYWRSQFTDPTNGVTYPITMVGNDPSTNTSVTVPTEIVPISLTFTQSSVPGLTTLDGASQVANTVNSPVFNASADIGAAANNTAGSPPPFAAGRTVNEPSDVTQVNDTMLRAQWGKTGSGYHVLLGQPTILPTQYVNVPTNQGYIATYRGLPYGLVDYGWFSNQLQQMLNALHVDSRTLPILLTNDTILATINPATAPYYIWAFHAATISANGNGRQQVQTFIWSSYFDVAYIPPNPGDSINYVQDIYPLTHEVQEWMDDPFISNVVTPWQFDDPSTFEEANTCGSNLLEVGDPVAGYGFTVTINGKDYHATDVVDYSWFARQNPSIAERGYYSYLNNQPTYSQNCT